MSLVTCRRSYSAVSYNRDLRVATSLALYYKRIGIVDIVNKCSAVVNTVLCASTLTRSVVVVSCVSSRNVSCCNNIVAVS